MNIEDFNKIDISIEYEDIIEKYSEELSNEIKAGANRTLKGKGKYAQGWTFNVKKVKDDYVGVVYNATDYQLTHLLEKGHVVKNQYGSSKGGLSFVSPRPHIKPAFDAIASKFIDEMGKAKFKIK